MKTSFGFGQLTATTPAWVRMIVALLFIGLYVAQATIQGDASINDAHKLQLINYLTNGQLFVLLVGELFGIKKQDNETK